MGTLFLFNFMYSRRKKKIYKKEEINTLSIAF